jgi:hypothetical protein
MPSKNSYNYYGRFLKCLKRNLEKRVEDHQKAKYDPEQELCFGIRGDDSDKILGADDIFTVFKYMFDGFIKKAPSACMGADDWLDRFFNNVDEVLCPGMWCHNEHCKHNNGGYPYNCSSGGLPSKCKVWKEWRFQWRSYPEKENCQKCRYFKPHERGCYSTKHAKKWEEANKYRCLCRAKELPEGCPKRDRGSEK